MTEIRRKHLSLVTEKAPPETEAPAVVAVDVAKVQQAVALLQQVSQGLRQVTAIAVDIDKAAFGLAAEMQASWLAPPRTPGQG